MYRTHPLGGLLYAVNVRFRIFKPRRATGPMRVEVTLLQAVGRAVPLSVRIVRLVVRIASNLSVALSTPHQALLSRLFSATLHMPAWHCSFGTLPAPRRMYTCYNPKVTTLKKEQVSIID